MLASVSPRLINPDIFLQFEKSLELQHQQKKAKINFILNILFALFLLIGGGTYLYFSYITKKTPTQKQKERIEKEFMETQRQYEMEQSVIHSGNEITRFPTKTPKPFFQVDLLPFGSSAY